jgi:hypothetical protein
VCSSASSPGDDCADLSRFDSSWVSCELGIEELELEEACWERSEVASFSEMYVSGQITSYYATRQRNAARDVQAHPT